MPHTLIPIAPSIPACCAAGAAAFFRSVGQRSHRDKTCRVVSPPARRPRAQGEAVAGRDAPPRCHDPARRGPARSSSVQTRIGCPPRRQGSRRTADDHAPTLVPARRVERLDGAAQIPPRAEVIPHLQVEVAARAGADDTHPHDEDRKAPGRQILRGPAPMPGQEGECRRGDAQDGQEPAERRRAREAEPDARRECRADRPPPRGGRRLWWRSPPPPAVR